MEDLLPKLVSGEVEPVDAEDRLHLAALCRLPGKRLHATAARVTGEALADNRKLAEDLRQTPRYHGACSAALAAAGQSEDAKRLPDRLVTSLRRQARTWLREQHEFYAELVQRDAKELPTVRKELARWLTVADLASVRDKDALDKLPEDERHAWRKLWADVAATYKALGEGP